MQTRLKFVYCFASILLASSSLPAIGADVVSFGIHSKQAPSEPDTASSDTQVTFVVLSPEEEKNADKIVGQLVNGISAQSPGAPIDLLCVVGGGMSAAACARHEKEVLDKSKPDTNLAFFSGQLASPPANEQAQAGGQPATSASPPSSPPPSSLAEAAGGDEERPGEGRLKLAIIRGGLGAGIAGTTIALTKHALGPAFVIAAIAGGWGGTWQYHNKFRINWIGSDGWFKVDHPEERAKTGAPAPKPTRLMRWTKRALFTTAYGSLLTGGYWISDLNSTLFSVAAGISLAKMVGESLIFQPIWDRWNKMITDRDIRRDPDNAHRYVKRSGFYALLQSMFAVVTNVMNIGDVKVGEVDAGHLELAGMGADVSVPLEVGTLLAVTAAVVGSKKIGNVERELAEERGESLQQRSAPKEVPRGLAIMGHCPQAFTYMGGY